jgi:hypothetical protein
MDCWLKLQERLAAARMRDEAVIRETRLREMLGLPQLKVLLAIHDMRKARGRAPTLAELVTMSRHPEERVLQHPLRAPAHGLRQEHASRRRLDARRDEEGQCLRP